MRRRSLVVLLAAAVGAVVFILPAWGAGRATHTARHYGLSGAIHMPRSAGRGADHVNVAWTPGSTMPVAVEETGGGAAAQNAFYVPGGYENFNNPPTLNNTVQSYNKTTNIWTNNTSDPIPPVSGLVPGLADAAVCFDPSTRTVHIIDGVAYDSAGNGFIIAEHLVYNPSAPAGTRFTFLSLPTDASGNVWFAQDQGCAFIGGKMYLFGGYGIISPLQPTALIENVTWAYDPATDTWSDTGFLMMHPRLWMGYAGNTTNAFAAGGTDNLTTFAPVKSTEKFTPATGWAATGNLPTALLAPGEGAVKTHLIVFGGGDSTFTTQNKTYGCTLPACGSFSTTAFNLPTAKWFMAFGSGAAIFSGGGDTGTGVPVNTSEHLP
jgi:hypothetical protein